MEQQLTLPAILFLPYPTPPPHAFMKVHFAIVNEDTLAALGLAGIIRQMMLKVEVHLFSDTADLIASDIPFHHYFVSTRALTGNAAFYLEHSRHTIVLTRGNAVPAVPAAFHTINVCQDEKQLTRSILQMAEISHQHHDVHPLTETVYPYTDRAEYLLTLREMQVLRGIVMGCLNKEIADELGITTATVITHRKHLTAKLGQKSVAALTIYAVMHGIVSADEI